MTRAYLEWLRTWSLDDLKGGPQVINGVLTIGRWGCSPRPTPQIAPQDK